MYRAGREGRQQEHHQHPRAGLRRSPSARFLGIVRGPKGVLNLGPDGSAAAIPPAEWLEAPMRTTTQTDGPEVAFAADMDDVLEMAGRTPLQALASAYAAR